METQLREQGWSYRRIGEKLNIGVNTARRDVQSTVPNGTVDFPDRIIGKDNKERPATKPKSLVFFLNGSMWSWDNLQSLCISCHNKKHSEGQGDANL